MKAERRHNWKEAIAEATKERKQREADMLAELQRISERMHAAAGTAEYDNVSFEYRQLVAKIVTN